MDVTEDIARKVLNNIASQDAENIVSINGSEIQYSQPMLLHVPKASKMLLIDESKIRKVHVICATVKTSKFPIAELFLSLASLFLGAFFSSFISQIEYASKRGIFFYTVCPILGVIFLCAYVLKRNRALIDTHQLAEQIENYLEIDEDAIVEADNEHK